MIEALINVLICFLFYCTMYMGKLFFDVFYDVRPMLQFPVVVCNWLLMNHSNSSSSSTCLTESASYCDIETETDPFVVF